MDIPPKIVTGARRELQSLLNRFNQYKEDKSFISNEKQACASLIVPVIKKILHWDTEDKLYSITEEEKKIIEESLK